MNVFKPNLNRKSIVFRAVLVEFTFDDKHIIQLRIHFLNGIQ